MHPDRLPGAASAPPQSGSNHASCDASARPVPDPVPAVSAAAAATTTAVRPSSAPRAATAGIARRCLGSRRRTKPATTPSPRRNWLPVDRGSIRAAGSGATGPAGRGGRPDAATIGQWAVFIERPGRARGPRTPHEQYVARPPAAAEHQADPAGVAATGFVDRGPVRHNSDGADLDLCSGSPAASPAAPLRDPEGPMPIGDTRAHGSETMPPRLSGQSSDRWLAGVEPAGLRWSRRCLAAAADRTLIPDHEAGTRAHPWDEGRPTPGRPW